VEEQIEDVLAPLGLRLRHLYVLRLLATGSQAQTALTRPLHANRMMVLRFVHELTQAGLVRRAPTAHHRRVYDVTLTAQGRAVLAQTAASVDAVETALVAPLSPAEQAQFRALLLRLMHTPDHLTSAADACAEGT